MFARDDGEGGWTDEDLAWPAVAVTLRGYYDDQAQHYRRLCVVVSVTGLSSFLLERRPSPKKPLSV